LLAELAQRLAAVNGHYGATGSNEICRSSGGSGRRPCNSRVRDPIFRLQGDLTSAPPPARNGCGRTRDTGPADRRPATDTGGNRSRARLAPASISRAGFLQPRAPRAPTARRRQ
jgi:hypothetical protein